MKKYEVIREIYNQCADNWNIDFRYPPVKEIMSPEAFLKEQFKETMIEKVSGVSESVEVYIVHLPLPEKYTFELVD